MPGAAPLERAAVLVDGAKFVGLVQQDDIPADFELREVPCEWLVPGLIDMHVHLVWGGGLQPNADLQLRTPEQLVVDCLERARAHLLAGVTTVCDLGGPLELLLAVREAATRTGLCLPRIRIAGPIITRHDAEERALRLVIDDPDEATDAVRALVEKGVDRVKVMATGGVYQEGDSFDSEELGLRELGAVVAEAHRGGRKVAAHAYTPTGIRNAIEAGADTVEHGSFLDTATAELGAKQGTVLVPTLRAYQRYVEVGVEGGLPSAAVRKAAEAHRSGQNAVRLAVARGMRIAAGTDDGGRAKPHGGLAHELTLLREAGLTDTQALSAATTVAAEAAGLPDVGRIAVGCRADMVGVLGDPRADVTTLAKPRAVVRAGRLVNLADERPPA